jgi:predicted kinase
MKYAERDFWFHIYSMSLLGSAISNVPIQTIVKRAVDIADASLLIHQKQHADDNEQKQS